MTRNITIPRQTRQAIARKRAQAQPARVYATIGKIDGTIPAALPDFVWVTDADGNETQVFNDAIPASRWGPGMPVWLARIENSPLWRIDAICQRFPNSPVSRGVLEHASTHSAYGNDPLWIWADQYMPWLCVPSGMTVKIYRMAYRASAAWVDALIETLDLASPSHIPATGALYVLVEIDGAGDLQVTDGAPVAAKELLTVADIPAPTPGNYALCAVRLYAGQTEIKKNFTGRDYYDLRFSQLAGGGGGVPEAPADTLAYVRKNVAWVSSLLSTLNDASIASATTGDALVRDGTLWKNYPIYADTFSPTGWLPAQIWSKAVVSVVTTKLRIVLSASANLTWYWRGIKTNLGATSLTVNSTADKAEGIWYCYSIDGGATWLLTQTAFYIFDMVSGSIRADLMAWEFYWDNTNNVALWIQPEFHASTWNRSVHSMMHEAFGTRYSTGLDITYGLTAANNDTRVKLTSGELHDEDISFYIVHSATPTAIGEQLLGSAGTADANFAALPIYYLSGVTPIWRKVTATSYPFQPVSNNYMYYNRNNAGTWDYTTPITNNDYVVIWVIGTTNQSEPIVVIPGRQDNANLTAAQAEGFPSLITLFTEYKLLYKIIYQVKSGNSNNGKCQIISVTDYRKDLNSSNAQSSPTVTAALVSFTPSGTIAATNAQAAIEELDTEKQPLDADLTEIAALTPTDNDIIQRKSSAWTNRTMAQLAADLTTLAPLASPALTGNPTAPTPAAGDNDTSIVTSAFVQSEKGSGWAPAAGVWTYSSADSPTFIASIDTDLTGVISVGMKIKLTQTTVKYFLCVAITSNSITLYGGTDYTLANAAISAVFYSSVRAPFGFPLDPAKWTVEVTDSAAFSQATPTQNVWYNASNIVVPIGVWRVYYEAALNGVKSASGTISTLTTFGLANNSSIGIVWIANVTIIGSGVTAAYGNAHRENFVTLAAKTTYYFNIETNQTNMTSIGLSNNASELHLRAVCAYL